MESVDIACLLVIIMSGVPCNSFVIKYICSSNTTDRFTSHTVMKDKLIAALCTINLWQILAYSIELHSAFKETISEKACEASAFIISFSSYMTIGCFIILLGERYMYILYPYKYREWMGNKDLTMTCLLLALFYGLFFGVAPLFGWGKYGRSRPNSTYCGFDFKDRRPSDKTFFFVVVLCTLILPFLLTSICIGHIFIQLRRKSSLSAHKFGQPVKLKKDGGSGRVQTIHEQYISSLCTAMSYMLSWCPYATVCFLFFYHLEVPIMLERFAIYLSKSNTITSPLVFYFIEKRVSKGIGNIRRKSQSFVESVFAIDEETGSDQLEDLIKQQNGDMI